MTESTFPPRLDIRHALFLDFDGTLAPLQDDRDSVAIPASSRNKLLALAGALEGAVAVISGRDVRDISGRVPADLWRIGGHGLERCSPHESPDIAQEPVSEALLKRVRSLTDKEDGVAIEVKGQIIAVHYRGAPHAGPELDSGLLKLADGLPDYRLSHGNHVLELKPEAANKGRAVADMMGVFPFTNRQPVMVGDDTTDEDAFSVVEALGGFAIKVGDGDTKASFRLNDPDAVWKWLEMALSE